MEPITSFEEMEPAQLKILIKYISDDISQNQNLIKRYLDAQALVPIQYDQPYGLLYQS